MSLGEKLKQARLTKNFSQEYKAEDLQISQKTYSNFENNKTKPDFSQIEEISKVFKVIDWNIFSPNTYNYQNDSLNILIEFSLDKVFEKLQGLDFTDFLGSCDFEEVLDYIIYYSLDYNEEEFIESLREL